MDKQYLYSKVSTEYKELQKEQKNKQRKVWSIFLAVFIVTIVTLVVVSLVSSDVLMNVLVLSIVGGISFIFMMWFLFITYGNSKKIMYSYLIDQIIKNINLEKGLFLQYDHQIKNGKLINKQGGLFTRSAQVDLKFRISGTKDMIEYNIQEARMYTSDGKNQYQVFKGIYMFIGIKEPNFTQVRSHSKPKLKGTKFIKVQDTPKVYNRDGESFNNKYLRLYEFIVNDFAGKKNYISANDSGVHIGVESQFIKLPTVLTEIEFNRIYLYIEKLVERTNQYCSIISDTY